MYPGNRTFNAPNSDRILRENPKKELRDFAKSRIGEDSFCISASKLWNNASAEIRSAKTINEAKRLIKAYSKNMPI